jgi:hypothetical protein
MISHEAKVRYEKDPTPRATRGRINYRTMLTLGFGAKELKDSDFGWEVSVQALHAYIIDRP